MSTIYKRIFAGYFLVILDFSIFGYDILPDPVGYFFILLGLIGLYSIKESNALKLGIIISIYLLIVSCLSYFTGPMPIGYDQSNFNYILMMIGMITSISLGVIIYQTSIHQLEDIYEEILANRIRIARNLYVMVNIILVLLLIPLPVLSSFEISMTIVITAVIGMLIQLHLLVQMNRIKKFYLDLEKDLDADLY